MRFFKPLFLIAILLVSQNVFAQDCLVLVDELKGKYTGDCVKGKANGTGLAQGTDTYQGGFKNGYPHGKGKYTWNDGSYYEGAWIKGLRDGFGTMNYRSQSTRDSVETGYWKRGKYIGRYEKPYEVNGFTSNVDRVSCRLSDTKGNNISIRISQKTEGVTVVTSIIPAIGEFYTMNSQRMTNVGLTNVLGVTFPFRAVFNFSNGQSMDITFNEKGSYDVSADLK